MPGLLKKLKGLEYKITLPLELNYYVIETKHPNINNRSSDNELGSDSKCVHNIFAAKILVRSIFRVNQPYLFF